MSELAPGMREKIYQERWDALSDEQRAAFEMPAGDRTEQLLGYLDDQLCP